MVQKNTDSHKQRRLRSKGSLLAKLHDAVSEMFSLTRDFV